MTKYTLTALAIVLLTGCAQQPQGSPVWRDLWANGDPSKVRGDAEFNPAAAQCDYELAQARNSAPYRPVAPAGGGQYAGTAANLGTAMLSGPAPDYFEKCMRAQGWEFMGYR